MLTLLYRGFLKAVGLNVDKDRTEFVDKDILARNIIFLEGSLVSSGFDGSEVGAGFYPHWFLGG